MRWKWNPTYSSCCSKACTWEAFHDTVALCTVPHTAVAELNEDDAACNRRFDSVGSHPGMAAAASYGGVNDEDVAVGDEYYVALLGGWVVEDAHDDAVVEGRHTRVA